MRVHLFEIEDQRWCPNIVRSGITDHLVGLYNILNIYEPAYKKVAELSDKTKIETIVDCCSGSGGPLKKLREYLNNNGKESIKLILTDKYPNKKLFSELELTNPNNITSMKESIDATQLPTSLTGIRTFFSSFHHFTPNYAEKILQDAVKNNMPIAIFESTQRNPKNLILVLVSPILMWFFMPLYQKFTWKKFLFTYIFPVIPLAFMWDYFVSCLRTYSPQELNALIKKVNAPGYTWEVGKLWSEKAKTEVPYLIGYKS